MNFTSEIVEYLNDHPDLKAPLNALLRASDEIFPDNEKAIRMFYDQDIEDSWLYVAILLDHYPKDLTSRIEKIEDAYLPLLEKCQSGWVTVMPEHSDFKRV